MGFLNVFSTPCVSVVFPESQSYLMRKANHALEITGAAVSERRLCFQFSS